jgi:hypothetical protein
MHTARALRTAKEKFSIHVLINISFTNPGTTKLDVPNNFGIWPVNPPEVSAIRWVV